MHAAFIMGHLQVLEVLLRDERLDINKANEVSMTMYNPVSCFFSTLEGVIGGTEGDEYVIVHILT